MVSAGETSMPISTRSSVSTHPNTYMSATSLNFFNTVTPVPDWSEGDVKEWLQSVGFGDLAQVSEEHGIDGAVLIHIDFESLKDLGFVKVGQRLRLMRLINELLGITEDFGSSRSHMAGDHNNFECNLWNMVHNQNDRIRTLENQVWTLQQTTQTLRERTDSLSSFNTSWTMQSCPDSLALQSSKPSADSGNSTPPTTASPIRTAVTKMQEASNFYNYTQSPSEANPYHQSNAHPNYTPPSKLSQIHTRRYSISPEGPLDISQRDAELSPSSSKTPLAMKSPKQGVLLPPFAQTPDSSSRVSQENSHHFSEPRRKYSGSKPDDIIVEGTIHSAQSGPTSSQVKAAALGGTGFVVGRKPSLITRRAGAPSLGIGSRSMRSGGASNENRTAVVCKRSSSTTGLSTFQDDTTNLKVSSPSHNEHKPLSPTAINRSASTSNLKAVNGSDSKLGHRLKRLHSQPSVKVKSNNEQTVIEVLSNHLSTFYVNEPHAWSKHVLLLRMNDVKEYCLSYDEIPLKVYRSFKPREGIDFAIRPIEDIPSPLRVAGNNRKKNPTFDLEDELAAPDDSKSSNEEAKKVEAERKPLPYGLALCGYQAELPDEINIKAGEFFKLKSLLKGRYLLERESNSISPSPLSAVGNTTWTSSPSPTRRANVTHNDNAGWVPQSCILEITQSMRTMNSNGSSLKHLISSPLENADEFLDLENLTTSKICLISFQSQFITWSGELTKVIQGEKIRAFNHKTRYHWVYCLRESSGERGWLPKWILSPNLQVLPQSKYSDPQNKLQTYLLQQSSNHLRNSVAKPHDYSSNRNVTLLGRSSSSASALKKAGMNKSRLSPTSLHSVRALNIQNLGSENGSETPPQLSPQPMTKSSPEVAHETSNPGTPLNRSIEAGRSLNFTPRSRRSRISSTLAS